MGRRLVAVDRVVAVVRRVADGVAAADAYWAATKGYWAAIRAKWDDVAATKGGIAIEEEAQTGTVISGRLLELADEVKDGTVTEAAAVAEATNLIDENTTALGG